MTIKTTINRPISDRRYELQDCDVRPLARGLLYDLRNQFSPADLRTICYEVIRISLTDRPMEGRIG